MNRRDFLSNSAAAAVAAGLAPRASHAVAAEPRCLEGRLFYPPLGRSRILMIALDAIAERLHVCGFMNTTRNGKGGQMLNWDTLLEEAAEMAEAAKLRGLKVAAAGADASTETDAYIAGLKKLIDVSEAATVPDILPRRRGAPSFWRS